MVDPIDWTEVVHCEHGPPLPEIGKDGVQVVVGLGGQPVVGGSPTEMVGRKIFPET